MNDPLQITHPGKVAGSSNLNMDEFVDLLMDHDIDMGVDRSFYDPNLREQYIKKQESDQQRLQALKKKQLQQEMLYYTIDEETGERIPKQNVDKSMPVPAYTEDIDLSKELAELGEIADFLGENQSNEGGYFNQPTTYSNLCSPTEQQNSVEDIWATQITMLPGPSYSNVPDMGQEESDMFMSQLWEMTPSTSTDQSTDYFGAYGEGSVMYHPQANSTAADVKRTQPTQYLTIGGAAAAFTDSPHSTADLFGASSDSGIEESYHTDQYGGNCAFSQSLNEDIKPQINFNEEFGSGNGAPSQNGSGGSNSGRGSSDEYSSYGGSENGDDKASKADSDRAKRNACRDEMRCRELGIPFDVEVITNYPVEEFNSLLRRHHLSEEQLTLIKDIRRRGKNKVAAQNCRKKKMSELSGLELEIHDLKRKRTELVRDKDELKKSKVYLKSQLDQTYAEVFNSIRDHLGRPYDPHFYTLHITDEGEARIIPNKALSSISNFY